MTLHPDTLDMPSADSSPDQVKGASAPKGRTSIKAIALQTVVVSLLIIVAVVVAGAFFKQPIQLLATWMVETFGIVGTILGICISDIFGLPIPPDTFIFIAATSGYPDVPVAAGLAAVSVGCGSAAYLLGPYVGRVPLLRTKVEQWRVKGEHLFERWGVWTVAIGALSPLPYSITCWFAGIYHMPYKRFFLATLFRIPRIVAYYMIFRLGWA